MITVIAGGTGSAKLVRGLAALVKGELIVIANVGDNIWLHGLYVCPDIDTNLYALSDMLDEKRGWGIRGDTFNFLGHMAKYGAPSWFSLGDRDLATHVLRTELLRRGMTLSAVTEDLAGRLGISAMVMPATDDPLTTIVMTDKGRMHLQEFWVKNSGRPRVRGVIFEGAKNAVPARNVLSAIKRADTVVIAPANPVSSIGPTLAMKQIRNELEKKRKKVIAVSPIVGHNPVSGPAAKYMKALGLDVSPLGVAKYLGSCVGTFVISRSDHEFASEIRSLGMSVLETDIMMKSRKQEKRLARYLLGVPEK